MKIVRSLASMRAFSVRWHRAGQTIAFVPTMGALHEGHLSLVRAARKSGGRVVVSIFVNPIQFGPKENFRKYPRAFRQDASLLRREGVDVLFHPRAQDMYPRENMGTQFAVENNPFLSIRELAQASSKSRFRKAKMPLETTHSSHFENSQKRILKSGYVPIFSTTVHVAGLSDRLCGKSRPGHFDGVATVVAKLFDIVMPDAAFFGQKDYQQCKIIQRMVHDLNLGVKIRMMPIVREKDGLAMSSRNRYLLGQERRLAAGIYAVLRGIKKVVQGGQKNARLIKTNALRDLKRRGISRIDYVEIVDGDTLESLKTVCPPAVVATAVRIGSTRLIDNMILAK